MVIKLALSLGTIAIASAFYVDKPMESRGHASIASPVPAQAENAQLVSDEANALAYSSIFPAFVPNTLPTANIADVAADAAMQEQAVQVDPVNPLNDTNLDEAPDDTVQRLEKPKKNNPVRQANAENVSEQAPIRSKADVSFLKNVAMMDGDRHSSAIANVLATLPAIKTLNTASIDSKHVRWPGTEDGDMLKVSTVHRHLQEFSAVLSPRGFQRSHWQDMSYSARSLTAKTDNEPFIVMIDPGHGGSDPGSKGHNGLLEKDLTLDIARRIRLFLNEVDDIDVRLTRHHDYGLSRQSRVDAIRKSEADMVISLHFNHLPQTEVNLVESYYAGRKNIEQSLSVQRQARKGEFQRTNNTTRTLDLAFTEGSARLAKTLQQHIFSEVSFDADKVQNAGVKEETLFVLTRSFTPAALIEISCLSHVEEADRLASDDYRNRLAAALVDGIRNYYDSIQRAPLKTLDSLGA
ncbi:MAG: N-acetylmuramoyl-L-alanine amidase [Granulosicoccus sp.]